MSRTLVAVALVALQLAAFAPVADAMPETASTEALLPLDVAAGVANLPLLAEDPFAVQAVMLSLLERQGALQPGTVQALMGAAADPRAPRPPGILYRDAIPWCDVDGDGMRDFVANELDLIRPPRMAPAQMRLVAVSGADGSTLWALDNMATVPAFLGQRLGEAKPDPQQAALPVDDLDGDGVCDAVAVSYLGASFIIRPPEPLPTLPSSIPLSPVTRAELTTLVRGISGATGAEIWALPVVATYTGVSDPLTGAVQQAEILNLFTGIAPHTAGNETRFFLKTTDVRTSLLQDPVGITGQLPIFRSSLYQISTSVAEHVALHDAATADEHWRTDYGVLAEEEASEYNITFITGVSDLDLDGSPDLLLDHYAQANPTGNPYNDPITGEPMVRSGRGMAMTAVAGSIEKEGARLWTTRIVPTETVRANLEEEELYETVVWTGGQVLPDSSGDGVPDPMAMYLAVEENMAGTPNGRFRTHFVQLDGTNGNIRWDVRQQGWGQAASLDAGANTTLLGLGTLDLPSGTPPGGRFPAKFVRIAALDARDGSVVWSVEKAFAQNSFLSYNLALGQFREALAAEDYDNDGVREVVSPAIYAPPGPAEQVLLATSHHSYEVRSGATGDVLSTIAVWGPDGRVVPCGDGLLSVVSGHSRRIEFSAHDVLAGARVTRAVIHNDPTPRAATAGIDLTGVGARCANAGGNKTMLAVNLQEFSYDRRFEVIPILGLAEPEGARWLSPELRGKPPSDALFQAAIKAETPPKPLWPVVGVGAAVGLVAAVASLVALVRIRPAARLLGIGLVLLTVTASLAPAVGALALDPSQAPRLAVPDEPAPVGAAPAPLAPVDAPLTLPTSPEETLATTLVSQGEDATAEELVAAVADYLAQAGIARAEENQSVAAFDDNNTISFTHLVKDVDGDNATDILFDQYCVDTASCRADTNRMPEETADMLTGRKCGSKHDLYLASGRNGTVVWHRDLTIALSYQFCGAEFVIGTIPLADGSDGILLYRVVASSGLVRSFTHTLTLLDSRDGSERWSFVEEGRFVGVGGLYAGHTEAASFALRPMIVLPDGTTGNVTPTILVEGMGFRYEQALFAQPLNTNILDSGMYQPARIVDWYRPDVWAARLDVETGAVAWRAATFEPSSSPERSVFPILLTAADFPSAYSGVPASTTQRYWDAPECCVDVTADGVPDLVYRTIEWSPTPSTNVAGPFFSDIGLYAFDGASGAPLASRLHATDVRTLECNCVALLAYESRTEPLGDVNGDGKGDLLYRETFRRPETLVVLSVLDGATLEPIWTMESARALRTLTLGDTDGDGANDILYVDWYGYENGFDKADDFVTPAATPLTVLSGATGERLLRTTTYMAPTDIVELLNNIRRSGVIDLDGDGAGEIPVDDPLYLDDQTVIHRLTFLSSRTGQAVFTVNALGTFAFPARAGDLDLDGHDDIALLSGDVNDLWLTLVDGADGQSVWARRLLATPSSSYAGALPNLRFHEVDGNVTGQHDLMVNFHLRVTTMAIFEGGDADGAGDFIAFITGTVPQVLYLDSRLGRYTWALPQPEEAVRLAVVRGASPGVQTFDGVLAAANTADALEAARELPGYWPAAIGFLAAYALVVALGIAILRLFRDNPEVPDLV